jgi:hypothetical protein
VKRTILLLVAASVVACGDPREPVVDEATPEPVQEPVEDRCEEPDAELVDLIGQRLDVAAELEHAQVVASEDEDHLRFLAAGLVGDDLDDEAPIGTWAVVAGSDDVDVYAVSAPARYLSSWPDGTGLEKPLTMETDGPKEAETCSEAAAR